MRPVQPAPNQLRRLPYVRVEQQSLTLMQCNQSGLFTISVLNYACRGSAIQPRDVDDVFRRTGPKEKATDRVQSQVKWLQCVLIALHDNGKVSTRCIGSLDRVGFAFNLGNKSYVVPTRDALRNEVKHTQYKKLVTGSKSIAFTLFKPCTGRTPSGQSPVSGKSRIAKFLLLYIMNWVGAERKEKTIIFHGDL